MISELADKHHAIKNWGGSLEEKQFRIYTLDLLEALRAGSNEPICIIADLDDLDRSSSGYLARFTYYSFKHLININITAEITPIQLAELRKHQKIFNDTFGIILEVKEVKREKKMGGIDSEGNVREEDEFYVSARCIDLIHLPDYFRYKFGEE